MSAFYNRLDFTLKLEVKKMVSENHNALRKGFVQCLTKPSTSHTDCWIYLDKIHLLF